MSAKSNQQLLLIALRLLLIVVVVVEVVCNYSPTSSTVGVIVFVDFFMFAGLTIVLKLPKKIST